MKKKKDNVTVRIYYDGTADAKDIIADAITARTDRAMMNEKTVEMPADIGYSKDEVCDDSHLALGLCG